VNPTPLDPASASIAVLCIDVQPVFLRAVPDGERLLRRCQFVTAAAHGLGLRVVFTEQVPAKLGGTAPELLSAAPGAPAFGKDTFSALADDTIRHALAPAEHLETPICVYQTALDALHAGLQVTLLSDAVGARRPDDATACLAALARAGAHVLPSESVFYALLGHVRHPFFKTYTQLVKSHG
jgi:nicotinamidase-related amidase